MYPTEKGIPTEYDRQFYYRVVQPLVAALRGRGEVSFEHNDNVWLEDCFVRDIVTAHRSAINIGVQRSGPQLKTTLEDIWHTLRGFDFRALMAATSSGAGRLRSEGPQVAARKVVQAKTDSDAKAAGTTASKQTKSDSSASSRTGGSGGGATNAGKTAPTPDRLPWVPERLYQPQLGPTFRNASIKC